MFDTEKYRIFRAYDDLTVAQAVHQAAQDVPLYRDHGGKGVVTFTEREAEELDSYQATRTRRHCLIMSKSASRYRRSVEDAGNCMDDFKKGVVAGMAMMEVQLKESGRWDPIIERRKGHIRFEYGDDVHVVEIRERSIDYLDEYGCWVSYRAKIWTGRVDNPNKPPRKLVDLSEDIKVGGWKKAMKEYISHLES